MPPNRALFLFAVLAVLLPAAVLSKCADGDRALTVGECPRLCATDYEAKTCDPADFTCGNRVILEQECCVRRGSSPKTVCKEEGFGVNDCYCSISGVAILPMASIGGAVGVVLLVFLCCCCYCCCWKKRKNRDNSMA